MREMMTFRGQNIQAFESRDLEILLAGAAGTGKAQPLSEPVMTPSGPQPMGNIRVGDEVLTPDGGTAKVVSLHPQGEQDVYRVRFSCGRTVRCTADHLWTVWRFSGSTGMRKTGLRRRPVMETVTTQQMMGRLTVGKANPRARYWVAPPKPVAMSEQAVPMPPYVLGVWLGDGSPASGQDGRLRMMQITSADPELVEAVRGELTDGHYIWKAEGHKYTYSISDGSNTKPGSFAPRANINYNGYSYCLSIRTLRKDRYVGSYDTPELAREAFLQQPELAAPPPPKPYKRRLVEMGLGACRSHEKFVPEVYKNNSEAVRLAVVQGLMDTDGTVDRKTGQPSYCTNSRQLARDFRYLIESLGGGVTIQAKRTKCRVAFNCFVRFDDPAKLFRLSRKKVLCKARTTYPFKRWVESIRYEGREACQCLTIDHPEHLYLTRGFVPTHNSVVLLCKCLALLDKYPGCRLLFCRGTRASLTQSGLVTWDAILERVGLGKEARRVSRRVRQSYEFKNGSEMVVAGLDDPGKTLSSEYDAIYIQEATEEGITLDVYETLLRALRNPAMPWHQIMMDCNPTTPTHWLYRRQASGRLRMYTSTHKDNPRYWDVRANDYTPEGRVYIEGTLARMTGARRKRFYLGQWSAAEGLIYDGYAPEVHNHPPGWAPPPDWPRFWATDWGFTNPSVLTFFAVDGDGRAHVYKEFYKTHTRAEELARWAKAEVESGREPLPVLNVADHDPECVETWRTYFPECPIEMADKGDKLGGIEAAQGRFDIQADGKPRIYFAPGMRAHEPDEALEAAGKPTSCMEELVGYIWDTKNPDRLKDEPLDKDNHAMDTLRYGLRAIDRWYGGLDAPTKPRHTNPFSRLDPNTFR